MAVAGTMYSIYDFTRPVRRVIALVAHRVPGPRSDLVSGDFLGSLTFAELQDLPQTGPRRALAALLEIHRVMGTYAGFVVPWARVPEPARSVLHRLFAANSGIDAAGPSIRALRAVTPAAVLSLDGVGLRLAETVLGQIAECLPLAFEYPLVCPSGANGPRTTGDATSENGDPPSRESLIDRLSVDDLSASVDWTLISANTRWRIKSALRMKSIDTARFPTSGELLGLTLKDLCSVPGVGALRAEECRYEVNEVIAEVVTRRSLAAPRAPVLRANLALDVLPEVLRDEIVLARLASTWIDSYEFGKERSRFVFGAEQVISLLDYLERTAVRRRSPTKWEATKFDLSEANWTRLESAAVQPDSPMVLALALLPMAAATRWTAESYAKKVGVDHLVLIPLIGSVSSEGLPTIQQKYVEKYRMASDLLAGATLQHLGDALGMTREGARRRLADIGFGPKDARAIRIEEKRSGEERERALKYAIESLVRKKPGMTIAEIAAELGLTVEKAQRAALEVAWLVLGSEETEAEDLETLPSVVESRERAIEAIREASTYALPLSSSVYDELRRDGRVDGLSAMRIIQLFETWSMACDEAGVESGAIPNRQYEQVYSREEVLDAVGEYLCDTAFRGSSSSYDDWRTAVGGYGIPSFGTVRKYLSPSWPQVRSEVLRRLRETWQ